MGPEIVAMIENVVSRIPELVRFVKEVLLADWNGHFGSCRRKTRNKRALIPMMMGKKGPINHTAARCGLDLSRIYEKLLAIAF